MRIAAQTLNDFDKTLQNLGSRYSDRPGGAMIAVEIRFVLFGVCPQHGHPHRCLFYRRNDDCTDFQPHIITGARRWGIGTNHRQTRRRHSYIRRSASCGSA